MTAQLYRCFDAEGNLLYVGATKNVFQRIADHQAHSYWFRRVTRVDIQHFDSYKEALDAEAMAVNTEHPRVNKHVPMVPGLPRKRTLAERKAWQAEYIRRFCRQS